MKKAMKVMDVLMGLSLVCLAGYAGVQLFRDAPVEPSWAWGFWAYYAGLNLTMDQIRDWE